MKILFQDRKKFLLCYLPDRLFTLFREGDRSPIKDTLPPGVRRFTMRRRGKTDCSWVEAKALRAIKSTGSQGTGVKLMTVEKVSLEQ